MLMQLKSRQICHHLCAAASPAVLSTVPTRLLRRDGVVEMGCGQRCHDLCAATWPAVPLAASTHLLCCDCVVDGYIDMPSVLRLRRRIRVRTTLPRLMRYSVADRVAECTDTYSASRRYRRSRVRPACPVRRRRGHDVCAAALLAFELTLERERRKRGAYGSAVHLCVRPRHAR